MTLCIFPSFKKFHSSTYFSEKHKKAEANVEDFAPIEITPTKVKIYWMAS